VVLWRLDVVLGSQVTAFLLAQKCVQLGIKLAKLILFTFSSVDNTGCIVRIGVGLARPVSFFVTFGA